VRVLITGAGGSLGRVLAPALVKRGHEPVLFDNRPIETPYPFQLGDVTNKDDVLEVMQGVDAVVHGAALHGIHLAKYTAHDFWNLNVTTPLTKICDIFGSAVEACRGQSEWRTAR
jgi:UDP-glucose 4-epimerase